MRVPSRALIRLSQIGLAVVVADLTTKGLADWFLGEETVVLLPWLHLHVVHNITGAFGWTAGAYTWQLNLALTLCAVVFVFPVAHDLARVDKASPRALGLIVGGALGNLASLVVAPPGVADFLAFQLQPGHAIVLNVADVAAYLGLAMILRTGVRIVFAIREQARASREVPVGSVYATKAAARGRLPRRDPVGVVAATREGAAETLVRDWSRVVDLGVVRADAPVRDETGVTRPLGAIPERKVKLVPREEAGDRPAEAAPLQER